MGVETEAEVRLAVPVLQVVSRLLAGAGEVGDFVLRETAAGERGDRVLVEVRREVVVGYGGRAEAAAVVEHLAAEA